MFRRIVSYLSFSPAMLWQLSRLDIKNHKAKKYTKYSLFLLLLNLLVIVVLFFAQPFSSTRQFYEHISELPTNLLAEISSSSTNINPGQPLFIYLKVKNEQATTLSQELTINLNKLKQYFILLPFNNPNLEINWQDANLKWKIHDLEPGKSSQQQFKLQAKNDFGSNVKNDYDNCQVNLNFGNNLQLNLKCKLAKKIHWKVLNITKNPKSYEIVILCLIILFFVKLVYWQKLCLTTKQTKLLRQRINLGKTFYEQ